MKIFYLVFISILALAACKDSSVKTTQGSMFPRGGDEKHLDRFEHEIQAFEAMDKEKMPEKQGILFIGSSSIRMWQTLENDFAPLPVLNRGFGGSTIPEVNYYAERILFKYEPKVIVFYCGENDVAQETQPVVVFQNFKKLAGKIEQRLPNTKFVFISLKPSPSRWHLWKQFQQVNSMVSQFVESRPNFRFLDIQKSLLLPAGEPDPAQFLEDKLHMNSSGYQKWVEMVKPVVAEFYTL